MSRKESLKKLLKTRAVKHFYFSLIAFIPVVLGAVLLFVIIMFTLGPGLLSGVILLIYLFTSSIIVSYWSYKKAYQKQREGD